MTRKTLFPFVCLFLLSGVACASSIYGTWEFIESQPMWFGQEHPTSKLPSKRLTITDKGITLPDGTACQFMSSKTVDVFAYDYGDYGSFVCMGASDVGITATQARIITTNCRRQSALSKLEEQLHLDELWIANEGNLIFMTWWDDVEWGGIHMEIEKVQ